jgi:hypothetical protein
MKKLFFTLALALVAVFNFSAKAQTNFFYVRAPAGSVWTYISSTNIGITTTQKTTIGGADNTLTVSPTGGYYTNPTGVFSYGAYWTTPSVIFPLKVSISSGYTATVSNPNSVARKGYLRVGLFNNGTSGSITYYNTATYTVPANGSITVTIPACSVDYTGIPGGSTVTGDAYPTLVYLQLQDVE